MVNTLMLESRMLIMFAGGGLHGGTAWYSSDPPVQLVLTGSLLLSTGLIGSQWVSVGLTGSHKV